MYITYFEEHHKKQSSEKVDHSFGIWDFQSPTANNKQGASYIVCSTTKRQQRKAAGLQGKHDLMPRRK